MQLSTPRLILRRWKPQDAAPFAAMNADPEVMEYFPRLLNAEESLAMMLKAEASFEAEGFGLWAAEVDDTFIGYVGLSRPRFESHFTPCVEIGWRLARSHWGLGLATEGARAVLHDGFTRLGLTEILSWTAVINLRSIRVMEKLGMARKGEFLHPLVEEGDRLKPHVLYASTAP